MTFYEKHKFRIITWGYWVLLLYVIAALVWWFISLEKQNAMMYDMRLAEINKDDVNYTQKVNVIQSFKQRKTAQYIGEGSIFLCLIIIGTVLVYRAATKQIKLQLQQQNFMMAVTHELKTPIAITKLNLETLRKRKLEDAQQHKIIDHTLQEADRLNALCNNILLASQIDAGVINETPQLLSFSHIISTSITDCERHFPNRKFIANITPDIAINGEPLLLQMLVNNLLENAIKYSSKDSEIQVHLSQKLSSTIRLQVIDTGIGITDTEKKKVFEKFYRVGSEQTRKAKGTGLGLYLCKKIVESYNGSIVVTDNQPTGCIFTVTI